MKRVGWAFFGSCFFAHQRKVTRLRSIQVLIHSPKYPKTNRLLSSFKAIHSAQSFFLRVLVSCSSVLLLACTCDLAGLGVRLAAGLAQRAGSYPFFVSPFVKRSRCRYRVLLLLSTCCQYDPLWLGSALRTVLFMPSRYPLYGYPRYSTDHARHGTQLINTIVRD